MTDKGEDGDVDPGLVRALLDPRSYPHAPPDVTLVQTHISCVFLAGDEVFKVKKRVRFSFLDFSTLELRRHFCLEEVRLNRRLAPGVYLGVVSITATPAGYRIAGDGPPVEYAVHMRRLPEDRVLRRLLERGEADPGLMVRIAEKMAAFHATADTGPAIAAGGDPAALRRLLDENWGNLEPYGGALRAPAAMRDLRDLLASALARIAASLRDRQARGRVRDCHGDLRPDHVCCTPELPIFDCIEFHPRFRHCDVASEMAFLAMELEYAGASELAQSLIDAYVRASGDGELPTLLPFFRAYRAQVRAMVAALTSGEPEVEETARARALAEARGYLALAERAAWSAQGALLIVVCGQSGTGKSTVASALAARSGLTWLRSDILRKRSAGLEPLERPASREAVAALYAQERSDIVYAGLATEAEQRARAGQGAIIDATFLHGRDRARIVEVAERTTARLFWVECRATAAIVRARLEARAARGDDPSDATWEIAEAQARQLEPLEDVTPSHHLVLATDELPDPAEAAASWLVQRLADPSG